MLKSFYIGSLFLVCITAFLCAVGTKQDEISGIEVISNLQFVIAENGQVHNQNDTVSLYFFKDFMLYREQYDYIKYNRNALHGDTVIVSQDPHSIDFREKRYNYFVWKGNESKGLKYRSENDSIEVINIDSIKTKKLFKTAQFYNVDYDRLVEKKYSANHKAFREKYANITKPDESYCDTTYYGFSSELNNMPYSLSAIADSVKKAKLVEVRYIYNPVPKGIDNRIDIPRREMLFMIKKMELNRPEEIMKIIGKFKKDSEGLLKK